MRRHGGDMDASSDDESMVGVVVLLCRWGSMVVKVVDPSEGT